MDFTKEIYKERRDKLAKELQDSALLLGSYGSAPDASIMRTPRQESSMLYLTGFAEENSAFLFRPGKEPKSILFVQPKDEVAELWEGYRHGPEEAKNLYGVDAAYSIDEFEEKLEEFLKPVWRLYYSLHKNQERDEIVFSALESARRSRGRSGLGVLPIYDPIEVLGEMRIIKSEEEIRAMQRAAHISTEAHKEAMRFTKPGVTERQVTGVLNYMFQRENSIRVAYPPIVGSGNNATVLHYGANNDSCRDGDLLLIDAGTEYKHYASDITRTFPVNGKFSPEQKDFYEAVLNAQMATLEVVKSGTSFQEVRDASIRAISQALLDLGFFKNKELHEVIDQKHYVKYYPHNIGHWLGLDTHDVGAYYVGNESRALEPNMVMTIEPGIYVPKSDDEAPEAFRGMGVRIEDDVLITDRGHVNMTDQTPKTVESIETIMAEESFLK